MKNLLIKSFKILTINRDVGFYSLCFIFIIPIILVFNAKKFDYFSVYCLIFVLINLYSIYFSTKNNIKTGLIFSLTICATYSINIISFLIYYDSLPEIYDELFSGVLKASHLYQRTLFQKIVENNPEKIHIISLFLLISYLSIFLSIIFLENKLNLNFKNQISKNNKILQLKYYFKKIPIFFLLSFLFLYLFDLKKIDYNSLSAILSAILRLDNFIILLISYYFFFNDLFRKRQKFFYISLIILSLAVYIYLTQSKALILLLCLTIFSSYIISDKKFSINIVNIFFIFILFLITFFLATYLKNPNPKNFYSLFFLTGIHDFIFTGLIGRLSYFEFYFEKVINLNLYKDFINLSYYFKVIIDKLTPGFDLYNVGFASRELYKSYYIFSDPNIMHSEQITPFAEAFILFKFYSIFYYIIIISSLIYILKYFSKKINFLNFLIMNYIFYIFVNWILGIGLDQLIIKIELLIIFVILFVIFNKLINKFKILK